MNINDWNNSCKTDIYEIYPKNIPHEDVWLLKIGEERVCGKTHEIYYGNIHTIIYPIFEWPYLFWCLKNKINIKHFYPIDIIVNEEAQCNYWILFKELDSREGFKYRIEQYYIMGSGNNIITLANARSTSIFQVDISDGTVDLFGCEKYCTVLGYLPLYKIEIPELPISQNC